jgi:hypothetical protein
MDYETADERAIADAIAEDLTRPLDYLPVKRDGAARAARLLGDLV